VAGEECLGLTPARGGPMTGAGPMIDPGMPSGSGDVPAIGTAGNRLRVERARPSVAVIVIDRAHKRNAMDPEFFHELTSVMRTLDADPEVRACVITGAGTAFSSGGDIATFSELRSTEDYRRQLSLVFQAFRSVEQAEVVVVAAVNGLAYAGGLELVLACDLAVAARSARFAFREVAVGLMPSFGMLRAPIRIGAGMAQYLVLTGNDVDAATAERIGLVQQVVPDSDVVEVALDMAEGIAALPPMAVAMAKQIGTMGIDRHDTAAREATVVLFGSEAHRFAVERFLTP